VDSFKTELIADRVWRNRSQLELAIVEYVGWFNHERLHGALGDLPPTEFETLYAPTNQTITLTAQIEETNVIRSPRKPGRFSEIAVCVRWLAAHDGHPCTDRGCWRSERSSRPTLWAFACT
jgi:hypothetical protein